MHCTRHALTTLRTTDLHYGFFLLLWDLYGFNYPSRNILSHGLLVCSTSTGRAIYVLYCHVSKLMSAVVVDPFNGNELLPSALERQFRDSCLELSLDSLSWDGIRFQVSSKFIAYNPCSNSPAFFELL